MYHDYFLTNRALQIQRLCERTDGNRIEVPDRQSRAGIDRPLANLFKLIDKILKLPVGDKQSGGLLTKLKLPSLLAAWDRSSQDGQKPLLKPAQRALLIDFERSLVRVRLSEDATSARIGTGIFNLLLSDHEYFNGLKPLPQYTDDFAYELLYPTWINLNTVMLQPTAATKETRFTREQQQTIINFLDEWSEGAGDSEVKLVAILTLIANRFEPPESHEMMQRTIDLCVDRDGDPTTDAIDRLWRLQEDCDSAPEVTKLILDFVLTNSSLRPTSIYHRFPITSSRVNPVDLPRSVAQCLSTLEADEDQMDDYRKMLSLNRTVIQQAEAFDSDFETLLNDHETQLVDLLQLIANGDDPIAAAPPLVQGIIAEIATRELGEEGQVQIKRLQPFTKRLAPRMNGLSRPTVVFVHADFIRKNPNRKALLSCAGDPTKRSKTAAQLLKIAKNTKNLDRFLNLLSVAAVVDPEFDETQLKGIQSSIAVLQLAHMEKSIGRKEVNDLEDDIREHLPDSLALLATPLQAALQKNERLAKLYLALNEEVQILQHSGTVSNFGVTRASFSHLEKLADEKE